MARLVTLNRLLVGHLHHPRESYWTLRKIGQELGRLRLPANDGFRRQVLADYRSFLFGSVRPVRGENRDRATAAVEWILRGQDATPDDGVSLGYFPCGEHSVGGWRPSYPETTGYIITSLLRYADATGRAEVRERALAMARWEVAVQMPSGAVQGGELTTPDRQSPAIFNTGMVLDGWVSTLQTCPDESILAAARRAADFLVADMTF